MLLQYVFMPRQYINVVDISDMVFMVRSNRSVFGPRPVSRAFIKEIGFYNRI